MKRADYVRIATELGIVLPPGRITLKEFCETVSQRADDQLRRAVTKAALDARRETLDDVYADIAGAVGFELPTVRNIRSVMNTAYNTISRKATVHALKLILSKVGVDLGEEPTTEKVIEALNNLELHRTRYHYQPAGDHHVAMDVGHDFHAQVLVDMSGDKPHVISADAVRAPASVDTAFSIARRQDRVVNWWSGVQWTSDRDKAFLYSTYQSAEKTLLDLGLNKSNGYVMYPKSEPPIPEDEVVTRECPNTSCGTSNVAMTEEDGFWWVQCNNCGVEGPTSDDADNAVEAWNRLPRLTDDEDFDPGQPPETIAITWDGFIGESDVLAPDSERITTVNGSLFWYLSMPAHARIVEDLKLQIEQRRSRAADALERLRDNFRLRPGCATINDGVEDVISYVKDLRRATESDR